MMIRKLAAGIAAAMISFAAADAATITTPLNITFGSGATFTGQIELADDFSRAYSATGVLSGYQNGVGGYVGSGSATLSHLFFNGDLDLTHPNPDQYGTMLADFQCDATSCVEPPNGIRMLLFYAVGVSGTPVFQPGQSYIYQIGYSPDYAVDGGLGATVPEPATWAMMITGFGLAGATLRRRRQAAILKNMPI